MQKILYILITLWLGISSLFGQYDPNTDYNFHPPLKTPLILAANFGELRTNHFHTGLDFKTDRQIGYPLYSIDEGYVARVKVSPWGYGHVVYIAHPNGLTSVYAHCSAFLGQLDSLVKAEQHKQENFAIEIFPDSNTVRVQRGEKIALSGNTGGSTAPHLHFEIRDTKTEHALNPLLFGFNIADSRAPRIRGVKVYALTKEGYRVQNKAKEYRTSSQNLNPTIVGNQITIPADFTSKTGGIGFSFDAVDQLDGANNICGIFKSYLIVDGDTVFAQDMTAIDFAANRQINSHKDYEAFHKQRRHYQKSFKTIHNPLNIYNEDLTNGILRFQPGSNHNITYTCVDTKGNTTSLNFTLKIENGTSSDWSKLYSPSDKYLFPDSSFMDVDEEHFILFGIDLLYEPTPKIITARSPFTFGNPEIPLESYYKIMMKVDTLIHPTERYVITLKDERGRVKSLGGTYKDGWLTARTREFGYFEIQADITAPTLISRNVRDNINVRGSRLAWRIGDDLSGLKEYDVYVDGVWQHVLYEPKNESLYYTPSASLHGEHTLKIVVEDAAGNISTESYTLSF
ncbi:peptidoglycan DD-metalloendopeptidase family protein [Lishizhenia sp.]|uniref:peptidoglycan DD-metalloendopeptidase family protein n=1 Tax=Lishizhenia sp. TaxID=2497594 RepID=UPI00299ECF93|nr:peptidoglycan DD-metalloendopeptidase family protein [Lishizhenia sp.]MDX1445051.1 peptidoglycan DD-metalloendopeptidase family protein [Lishizhenia sp.]